jgi:myo-inositol-1(or 4)-monophosphatase
MKKQGGDPVTVVDLEIDRALHATLLRKGEGWLSEETADDYSRLEAQLTWIVDPLDGTREFVDGLPEFCTSIAAVIDGLAVAGGILNPAAGFRAIGAEGIGVTVQCPPVSSQINQASKHVLASRSEVRRGQWDVVRDAGWSVAPMGSVAYKIARVASGLDPITWTPIPKHEWDVAGGAALLRATGGRVLSLELEELAFNKERPWLSGAIAVPADFQDLGDVRHLIGRQLDSA